jgi:hypothetical protein
MAWSVDGHQDLPGDRRTVVIAGADQKTTTNPAIRGCRMRRYSPRSVNGGGLYLTCRACSQACRNPNRSKWLIRKVELTAVAQPAAYTARSASAPGGIAPLS